MVLATASIKHGQSGTRAHNVWRDMLKRCKTHPQYAGRGIKVCRRWHKFQSFYEDMGTPPDGYSIERINNNDDYKPSNCKWIPRDRQSRNTGRSIWLIFNGETKTLAEWCDELGLKYTRVYDRLRKLGWGVPKAFTEPPQC